MVFLAMRLLSSFILNFYVIYSLNLSPSNERRMHHLSLIHI